MCLRRRQVALGEAKEMLGLVEGLRPTEPPPDSAEHVHAELPRNLEDVNFRLHQCAPLANMLRELLVQAFCEVKELEFATFSRVIGCGSGST